MVCKPRSSLPWPRFEGLTVGNPAPAVAAGREIQPRRPRTADHRRERRRGDSWLHRHREPGRYRCEREDPRDPREGIRRAGAVAASALRQDGGIRDMITPALDASAVERLTRFEL